MHSFGARLGVADAASAAVGVDFDRSTGALIPVISRSEIVAAVPGATGPATPGPAAPGPATTGPARTRADRLAILGIMPVAAALFERVIALPEEVMSSVVACVQPGRGTQ